MEFLKKHIVITGHYGTGKSNIAVNIAIQLSKKEKIPIVLIDADVVNPFFRSSDNSKLIGDNNISLISPNFAGTNLEAMSLPPDILGVFNRECKVVWDIGGDDAGAIVLGKYSQKLQNQGYEMLYVINKYRPLTEDSDEMEEYLNNIQIVSRLEMSGIINNSNLGVETTAKIVEDAMPTAFLLSQKTGLPIKFHSVSEDIAGVESTVKIKIVTKEYF